MKKTIFAIATTIALAIIGNMPMMAQGTLDDYNRAYELPRRFSADKVYYSDVNPHWVGGTTTFWYVRNTPEGRIYTKVDARKRKREVLFDHKRLADRLHSATGKEVKPTTLHLSECRVTKGLDTLIFLYANKRWTYSIRKNRLTDNGSPTPRPHHRQRHWMEEDDEKGGRPVVSPDGKHTAYIKNDNIFVREQSTGKERQLSHDGTLSNYYSSYIQWSPDSRKVASIKIRPIEKRYVYYVESSPQDQLQPRLHKQEYAKPGDERTFRHPAIFDVESGAALIPSTELFACQYDLHSLRWNADSRALTFEYNQRGHQIYRVLEMSAEDASVRTLIEEKSETFVNYNRRFRHDLKDGSETIWMSERDNWNHLYMYDRERAAVKHQITRGEWYVRNILRIDEEKRQIYFTANGVNPAEDPYFIHYYRINFDGSGMTALTPDEGTHKAWFSADMRYIVDSYSMVNRAPVTVLRDGTDGSVIMELEKADISRLVDNGWQAPEPFVATGRDGKTKIYGNIYRPTNFDPKKKYPIIEYIYAGPGDHYVPKAFQTFNWFMSPIAELGFIVVQIDGMGTSFRSKAFEDVCYKNLKDAGLPDHILWIKAAAKKYPYMDADNVGIFGCSAGGQESMGAVLFHPEFYKAAFSACGCHDNRMDKIWWNEQWMGYPVGEQYKASSNVENAHLLSRPLMLLVGEMDDNVDPASTMQVANALIKANKDFELVVIPGAKHTMGESFGDHKRFDFFVRHLLGVTPPRWDEIKYQ